jgi:hypothetical protein
MSLFLDPQDKERICQVLKAFVEEWGIEAVSVAAPLHWKNDHDKTFRGVRLEFATKNTIAVRVDQDGTHISFEVPLIEIS